MPCKAQRQTPDSYSTGCFRDASRNPPVRWLAIYVALSRVRNLENLRSVGLNKDIRRIMEAGPPDSLPAQFHKLFHEKEAQTALHADAAMAALGWSDGAAERTVPAAPSV